MPRYRRFGGGYRGYSRRSSLGYERAREHIAEARRLSIELGGMDQAVKAYFLALSSTQLDSILWEYRHRYGRQAEEYARKTIPRWRSGAVQMSGMVAERLFDLLPPLMPLDLKYLLTEALWRHVGPSSKKTIRVGLDADLEDVVELARRHIEEVVTTYRIPDQLEKRFDWLSAGDVGIKQDLLNHVREMEKALVVEAARQQMPILMSHLSNDTGRYTSRLAQILRVGKHELELLLDRTATGARIETPMETARHNRQSDNSTGWGRWWWLLLIAAAVLWYLWG